MLHTSKSLPPLDSPLLVEELGVGNQHLTTPDNHVDAAVESN